MKSRIKRKLVPTANAQTYGTHGRMSNYYTLKTPSGITYQVEHSDPVNEVGQVVPGDMGDSFMDNGLPYMRDEGITVRPSQNTPENVMAAWNDARSRSELQGFNLPQPIFSPSLPVQPFAETDQMMKYWDVSTAHPHWKGIRYDNGTMQTLESAHKTQSGVKPGDRIKAMNDLKMQMMKGRKLHKIKGRK